jgi:hypothetical protein
VWEIAPAGAAAQRDAGGEPSGSTTRSAEREDFAKAKPQGNPSPTTTYENTDHCECDGLFYFRKHAAGRLRFVPRQGRFISAAGRCFIRRSRASFFFSAVPLKQTFTDSFRPVRRIRRGVCFCQILLENSQVYLHFRFFSGRLKLVLYIKNKKPEIPGLFRKLETRKTTLALFYRNGLSSKR